MTRTWRAPRVSRPPALLLPLLLAAGCADPHFPDLDGAANDAAPDGQEASFGSPDAAVCPAEGCPPGDDAGADDAGDAALTGDPVRDNWVGRYAVRSTQYASDGLINSTATILSVVEIKPSADGLVLQEQLCKFEGGWSTLIVEGKLRYEFPPVQRTAPLTYDAEKFSSATNAFAYGYGDLPAGCQNATSLAVTPVPAWRTGDCLCGQESGPPADVRDCRILDPENDNNPGVTLSGNLSGTIWNYYVAQEQRVRYIGGYRQGKELYANQEQRDTTKVFGCNGQPPGGCIAGGAVPCPSSFNKAKFVPVGANFDCERVIAQEAGLFPDPPSPFPAGCPATR